MAHQCRSLELATLFQSFAADAGGIVMATSEAEICSVALTEVGAKPITSLTENTREAKLCARHYPKSVAEVLRMAPWQCALKTATLQADNPSVGDFAFAFSYQLPPRCVRVWSTNLDREW